MEWYYQQDNAAQGPVSEEVFRSKIADGTIRPDTLVWHDGMPEWQPLSVADPRYATGGAGVPPPVPEVFVPSGATATIDDLKTRARTGPKGNYWTFAGALVLWQILGWGVNFVPVAGTVAALLFAFIQQYGVANMGLRGADHRQLAVGDSFIGFSQFGRAFACGFLVALFTFLWSLLLVIPGIVKAFSYMLTPYIVLENPQMPVTAAIDESRRLMDGNKWRAFCLALSFIGWWILGVLTLGLLWLWVAPYQAITFGAFYRAVLREKGPAPAAAP
jgi:uncharacterized membrane protein